jgi:hypothetical protein
MSVRPQIIVLLLVFLTACTEPSNSSNATPTVRQPSSATPPGAAHNALARTWVATGITFNGNADPNFDASRRVELKLEPGGRFTMSGSGRSMAGQWKQEGATELQLVDDGTAAPQRFGIDVLDSTQLVLKLLDEMNAEVKLHYRAE